MRVSFGTAEGGRCTLRAKGDGRWDGSPTNEVFTLDMVPRTCGRDRIAVAGTLLFGAAFGGVLDFGGAITLVTADAVCRFCSPVHVYPSAIDEGPKPIPSDSYVLAVGVTAPATLTKSDPTNFSIRTLELLESHVYRGALNWHRGAALACNAWLFDEGAREGQFPGTLAAAVLFAGDFGAGVIDLSALAKSSAAGVDEFWLGRCQDLLSSVGLGLTV